MRPENFMSIPSVLPRLRASPQLSVAPVSSNRWRLFQAKFPFETEGPPPRQEPEAIHLHIACAARVCVYFALTRAALRDVEQSPSRAHWLQS